MAKESCLVTGGAGFIASHVAEGLLKKGHRVRILDNLSTGFLKNIQGFKGPVDFIRGDVRKESDIAKAVKGCKYVFHLAANRAVLKSVENPKASHDVNATGTLNMLIAARAHRIRRFIFTSSSSIYGSQNKKVLSETDIPKPESPYAATKILGEYYCSLFTSLYGLETVSLRYFNVFGPRQNPESRYSAVIPIFIESLMLNKRPEVHWDGRQSRDFHYVDSVVAANLLAMKAPGAAGKAFNVGSGEEYSVLYILRAVEKILGKRRSVPKFAPKREGDVRRTKADLRLIRKVLKYKTPTAFDEGLKRTVHWFLSER